MKSIFLCDELINIKNVYLKTVINSLIEEAGLIDSVFDKNYVLSNFEEFSDVDYIFSTWGMPMFSEEEIKECFPSLKCIFYAAGTVQSFAKPFLNCGVKVFSAWAANAVPVAEYTVAQIILANKGFFQSSLLKCKEEYDHLRAVSGKHKGNYNAKIGIIGAGAIGKLVIKMLKAYNLEVLVFDPFLPDEIAIDLGVKKVSLKEIFAECDVISNHLANNEQTKGILNGELFEKMPQYSTFLNTGRGAQVVESELCEALKKRPDIVAILDVTEPEPPENNHDFYKLKNCILTPHIAGSSGNETYRMAEYMLEEHKRYKNGLSSRYEVTLEILKTMA